MTKAIVHEDILDVAAYLAGFAVKRMHHMKWAKNCEVCMNILQTCKKGSEEASNVKHSRLLRIKNKGGLAIPICGQIIDLSIFLEKLIPVNPSCVFHIRFQEQAIALAVDTFMYYFDADHSHTRHILRNIIM